MIQVEFSQAAIAGSTLRVGVVVRGPEGSWVQFAQIVVDQEALEWGDLDALLTFASQATNRYLDREQEHPEEDPLPGL
jgi:hypothetical protein